MTLRDALRNLVDTNAVQLGQRLDEVLRRHEVPQAEVTWGSPSGPLVAALEEPGVWEEIAPDAATEHPGFLRGEFRRPDEMEVGFLRLLHSARLDIWRAHRAGELEWDVPMRVISDARDPGGSLGASRSEHKNRPCRAVDLQVYNAYERGVIIVAAARRGIVRFGTYPGTERVGRPGWPAHATDASGLHLDASTTNRAPAVWTRY